MSFQVQQNRRGSRRFPSRVAPQEWVRSGISPSAAILNSPSSSVSNPTTDSVSSDRPSLLSGNTSNLSGSNGGTTSTSGHRVSHGSKVHRSCLNGQKKERGNERTVMDQRKGSKDENLPQLAHEIQEKLMKGTVECMICCDMVRRTAPIWSCSSCCSIFHLNCIKKWARAPTSSDLSVEKNGGVNWRCPGCQKVQLTSSNEIKYLCFCGKRTDPPSDFYLTPHSCGESCGKPLQGRASNVDEAEDDLCPHVCVLQCHPGPCPPCKAFAPPQPCPCGKEIITTRCSDRKSLLTCGQKCDKLLECGRHRCEEICHLGPCDPCHALFDASCFCKRKAQVVPCGDMDLKGELEAEQGVFSCGSTCGEELGCGNHKCHEICHPGPCGECESLPSRVKTCYCGKTVLPEERRSCLEPIPTCLKTCDKPLTCGIHRCKDTCHAGDCAPCLVPMIQKCRCGSTSRAVPCHKIKDEIFTCEKLCGRKKNCSRHRCSNRCCPQSSSDTTQHFCTLVCDKKLRCGQHSCEMLCHSGHCPPCLQSIFTDLSCACGRTSIPPPLPCGTPPPSCLLPCSVVQACGHTPSHCCHFGDCPPCTVPVVKECIGGHIVLRNIPCGGTNDITCTKLCGKTRRCGLHACGRACHLGPCDADAPDESHSRTSCGQVCGAPRRTCRHTCKAPCHPSYPCPEVRCAFVVTIVCSCGRIKANVPCDAGGSDNSYVGEASLIQKLPPLQPLEASSGRIPLGQRKLMCDDECAKLERKRVLADAFNVVSPNLDALRLKENTELVADLFRRDPKWVLSIEDRCKFLLYGKSIGSATILKVHVFRPMHKEKREAVRLIADRWKLTIYEVGREQKCFTVIRVTPKSKAPVRMFGNKGSMNASALNPPTFDPLVDMDPRYVVSFFDLPRESDISALVLRFGGECELLWLNDKNALALFSNMTRAATATRTLDHGSVYHGAVAFRQNGASSSQSFGTNAWRGPAFADMSGSSWKKVVVQEPGVAYDTGDDDEGWSIASATVKGKEAPSSASATARNPSNAGSEMELTGVSDLEGQHDVASHETDDMADVVDDWETAFA